jgi:hypothetical protein
MQLSVHFVLMLIAVICLFCGAINRPAQSTISLGWLGMFFWALDLLLLGVAR